MVLLGGYLLFDTVKPLLRWLLFPAMTKVRVPPRMRHAVRN
jgi:hypothetical protein